MRAQLFRFSVILLLGLIVFSAIWRRRRRHTRLIQTVREALACYKQTGTYTRVTGTGFSPPTLSILFLIALLLFFQLFGKLDPVADRIVILCLRIFTGLMIFLWSIFFFMDRRRKKRNQLNSVKIEGTTLTITYFEQTDAFDICASDIRYLDTIVDSGDEHSSSSRVMELYINGKRRHSPSNDETLAIVVLCYYIRTQGGFPARDPDENEIQQILYYHRVKNDGLFQSK